MTDTEISGSFNKCAQTQCATPSHPRRGDWVVQGATPGQAPVVGGLAATSEGEGAGHDRATHVDAADGRHQHRGQQDEHHRDAHCRVHGRLQVLHAGAQPLVWGPWQDTHQRVRRVGCNGGRYPSHHVKPGCSTGRGRI